MTALAAVPRGTKAPAPIATLDEVLLELIDIEDNVRKDVGDLAELAASIHELGVIQAIKVTAQPDGRYRLVYGQRRVLASRKLGRQRIPALIEPPSDVDVHGARRSIEQLSENLQRKDLNPIEEAVALREVLDETPGLTQEALADKLGMSRPWISNTLGLLEAAPEVQAFVRDGRLTLSHVKALRGLAPKTQVAVAKQAIEQGASAHRTEAIVQDHKRNEEWRKEQEARSRKEQEARVAKTAASVERLAKYKVPLDAEIRVTGYYDKDAAAAAIKKAGYTNVKTSGEVRPRTSSVGCDCEVWKAETQWGGTFSVSKGCIKPAHVAAKSRLSDHLDNERRKLAQRSRDALKARLLEECRGLPRLLARVVLWRALDWSVNDWVRAHKVAGKQANAWEALTALTDEQLAVDLAEHLSKRFQDQNGIKLDWTLIAAELGLTTEDPPAPEKPKRAKKAAASA
jgi:ParB/RepB/Spo0J family partition protein